MALARLADQLADEDWVVQFEKPKGDPSAWPKPATTVLSPYLKFGCLSDRLFYAKLHQVRLCASCTGLHVFCGLACGSDATCRRFELNAAFCQG